MPTSLIDKIRAALKRPAPTTAQLADALDDARRAQADATVDVEKAAAVVAAGFMDPAAKRQADRDVLATAREAAEDASLVLAEVERRHAAALEADEQARRMALYTSAKARADEAAADLARSYPDVVKAALKMLQSLAEAQRDVQTANAQLPAGLSAIEDPEHVVRARTYRPPEIVSEVEMVLWTRHDMATPADEPFQSQIQEAAHGWGIYPGSADGKTTAHDEPAFLRVRYRRREVRQHVNGSTPAPLAVALRLPDLQGDGLAWGAGDIEGHVSPVLMAAMAGQAYPDVVLGKLHELDAATPARSKVDEPEVSVDWEVLGYEGPVPLKPALHSYHAAEGENPDRLSDHNPRAIGSDLVGLPGMSIPGTGVPVRPRFGASPFGDDARR